MRQHRWMEYLEDYEFTLHYHPSKANVVADALNQKLWGVLASIASLEWQMLEIVGHFRLYYKGYAYDTLRSLVATPSLLTRVNESQGQDTETSTIRDRVQSGISEKGWAIHSDGSLQYRGRVVVPQLADLIDEILRDFH